MEAPSAQNVGREFVRQYYTMLNEAPQYLHMFYSHNSSFVHGGVERAGEESSPAIGQTEIFKKIASLNFRDCHAKIYQVDSQSSVDGTVVIQVVGELSNGGEGMRRFMQTFVLAPQSAKKYYVHNDIFRYQDQVFHQQLGDNNDTGIDDESQVEEQLPAVAAVDYQQQLSNGDVYHHEQQQVDDSSAPAAAAVIEPLPAAVTNHVAEEPAVAGADEAAVNESSTAAAAVEEEQVTAAEPESEPQQQQLSGGAGLAPVEKPTWAAMASRNTVRPQATIRPEQQLQPRPAAAGSSNGPLPQRQPAAHRVAQQQHQLSDSSAAAVRPSDDSSSAAVDDSSPAAARPAQQLYPDSQQVFVGNVPHFISDEELKEYLEQWGKVTEVRITRKLNTNIPNYGFVVFDSDETVRKILNSMPLPKLHNKHRINIEEKKPREDMSRPRSAAVRSSQPAGGPGPQKSGPPSAGGPMRPGPAPAGDPTRGGSLPASGPTRGGPQRPGPARGPTGYTNGGRPARNYTKSGSSDDGRTTQQH